jgi:hypothetical protein
MEDELNPDFLFNLINTEILIRIARGEVDANALAIKQLIDRGIGKNGNWIGFPQAAREWYLPDRKPIQFYTTYVRDAWTERTVNGFIDYIKLKNFVLITIDRDKLSMFDADDLEVKKSRVNFGEITTLNWKADDKK